MWGIKGIRVLRKMLIIVLSIFSVKLISLSLHISAGGELTALVNIKYI